MGRGLWGRGCGMGAGRDEVMLVGAGRSGGEKERRERFIANLEARDIQ